MSNAWAGGSTRQWRRIREAVLEFNRQNYGGQCRAQCIGLCEGKARHAHHTLGRAVTGDDPRYIEGVCAPCNLHIGDPTKHPRKCPLCVNVQWVRPHIDPKPLPFKDW